jgi:hypothetical protein
MSLICEKQLKSVSEYSQIIDQIKKQEDKACSPLKASQLSEKSRTPSTPEANIEYEFLET